MDRDCKQAREDNKKQHLDTILANNGGISQG
jgi:hypothetical protein